MQRIEEYFNEIARIIGESPVIISFNVQYDVKSSSLGLCFGSIVFKDNSILEFSELARISADKVTRPKYRFHYYKNDELIFRYDNAKHHPEINTFPNHKHTISKVISSKKISLVEVLTEIESLL